ncbi:hypothetical protein [Brevibacillus daliensis]|uniref:hypothetical protein n=1 Tax=Brevibacillus daliensis TaxID=2892995 RepID=UPI001E2A2AB0|nr:hypothetical protein [Brevibacillus daliensis]
MTFPFIINPAQQLRKVRDLTLFHINKEQFLVIACDSDGGIGSKQGDVVQVSADTLGRFAVRVPLFEQIACGSSPFLVIDCLSVEMEPTGREIIQGIKNYAAEAGLADELQFTGSTEENVPTIQTGVGITVLGLVPAKSFYPGTTRPGDVIVCAGLPKSGPKHEVRLDDPEILSLQELMWLRSKQGVHDIIPVGSKGIRYELNEMIAYSQDFHSHQIEWITDCPLDLAESAGPSTCALFSVAQDELTSIRSQLTAPIHPIAYVKTI